MALPLSRAQKHMKRTESKKSHSWWWDSHISPKNSKWLAENLEEMDQRVKRMLKLIEEDADSFAKKAEMYYQKRPELLSLVEEFYRMYRALAERYDQVTGELRKNIPSDLQSQGSGISDVGSEPPSTFPSPDQRPSHRKSGPRAAGFEFFLGSAGSSSDLNNKEEDETSTLDSESESDDSSVNNYLGESGNGRDDQGLRQKIMELEVELRDVKEKLRTQEQENAEGSFRGNRNENSGDLFAKIAEYDEELRLSKEKIRFSEEEITSLKIELQKCESVEFTKDVSTLGSEGEAEKQQTTELLEKIAPSVPETKIEILEEELRMTKEKLQGSENEVSNLKHELESNGACIRSLQKEVAIWEDKLNRENREASNLQDRIYRYKANLSDRDQEIRELKETISNANKSLSEENSQLQSEVAKLVKERAFLEDNLKEWEFHCQSLEEEIKRVKVGKIEMEDLLGAEIEQLKANLNKSLDEFKLKYEILMGERDELNAKVITFASEVSFRDDRISQMDKHLHQLHMEHVELISGTKAAYEHVEELRSRVKELEREVERQRLVILEGAEEKREAIRQLCFSLEHYRNGYHRLRQAFVGHKRLPIMAS